MQTPALLILLTAHFVGDFLLQSNWMALNKSKRWWPLTCHAFVYAGFVGIAGNLILPNLEARLWFWAITLVTHFLTDAVTSRWTTKLWFFRKEPGIWAQAEYMVPKHGRTIVNPWVENTAGDRHWFFVVIGLDQLIHAWTLGLTYLWLVQR